MLFSAFSYAATPLFACYGIYADSMPHFSYVMLLIRTAYCRQTPARIAITLMMFRYAISPPLERYAMLALRYD